MSSVISIFFSVMFGFDRSCVLGSFEPDIGLCDWVSDPIFDSRSATAFRLLQTRKSIGGAVEIISKSRTIIALDVIIS